MLELLITYDSVCISAFIATLLTGKKNCAQAKLRMPTNNVSKIDYGRLIFTN